MSAVIRQRGTHSSPSASEQPVAKSAPLPQLRFARRELEPGAWRRCLALARRSYGPLTVYAILGIAFFAALAIRIAAFLPLVWR